MEISNISRKRFLFTVGWGVVASLIIVGAAAGIGRATVNLQGALTNKPDIAIYLLLPDEGIGKVELLREKEDERHYLAHTKDGLKVIILRMGEKEWYVAEVEAMHEDANSVDEAPTEETQP